MTAVDVLDPARRYLKPVPHLDRAGRPDSVHLALYGWDAGLNAWVAWTTALCGRSTVQGDLPVDAAVTCGACLGRRPQYQAILDMEVEPEPPVAVRVAARHDPRYPTVLCEVSAFGWPSGEPMIPGTWADILATRIMTALRTQEAS